MSLMHLALNPNLTIEQFREAAETHTNNQKRIQETFIRELEKIESPQKKVNYITACMPTLIMGML